MDDVVAVTVVDTLENLLHEDGGVLLRELASLDDLIEELSSLADPIGQGRRVRILLTSAKIFAKKKQPSLLSTIGNTFL